MISTDYPVAGLTCAHCGAAVRDELATLAGVTAVAVDLVAGGISVVTVTSDVPLARDGVERALDEAGGYRLADTSSSNSQPSGGRT